MAKYEELSSNVRGGIYPSILMRGIVPELSRIISREEAGRVLECLSPTLRKAIVAIAICDVKTSKELARALGMSIWNAQRVLAVLERIKAVKIINYGKRKIIVSLNPYYEKEVVESIKTLVPIVIDSLRFSALKLDKYHREIVTALVRVLGSKPSQEWSREETITSLAKTHT